MFGLFKKKSQLQILEKKHQQLLKEAYDLSTSNRMESYKKYAEAEQIQQEIETLAKAANK